MRKGFTVVELVFVIVVLAILVGFVGTKWYLKYVEYQKNQSIIEYVEKGGYKDHTIELQRNK